MHQHHDAAPPSRFGCEPKDCKPGTGAMSLPLATGQLGCEPTSLALQSICGSASTPAMLPPCAMTNLPCVGLHTLSSSAEAAAPAAACAAGPGCTVSSLPGSGRGAGHGRCGQPPPPAACRHPTVRQGAQSCLQPAELHMPAGSQLSVKALRAGSRVLCLTQCTSCTVGGLVMAHVHSVCLDVCALAIIFNHAICRGAVPQPHRGEPGRLADGILPLCLGGCPF